MKNRFLVKLRQPKIVILVIVGVLIIAGLAGLRQYNQSKPLRVADAFFESSLADLPALAGTPFWSSTKDNHLEPSSGLIVIEPHAGYITRKVTQVAATDEAMAAAEYNKLAAYMTEQKGMKRMLNTPDKQAYYTSEAGAKPLTAEIFILRSSADIDSISITLKSNPELDAKLRQHFSQSSQPVYGYVISSTYSYK